MPSAPRTLTVGGPSPVGVDKLLIQWMGGWSFRI